MRQSPARSALPLLILGVLLVPAVQPLLSAEFTCGYDNGFHLWRAVEVGSLLRQGVLFSHWAPDMAHGFGFPLFSFQSPGSAYAAAALQLLGLPWPLALNAVFALGIVLGALFVFLLARDLFGLSAGVVAAVAYAYAPYLAYDVFNRGSLSEGLAWAFAPLVLWAVHRWATCGERRFLPIGALGLAGFILAHAPFAFLFSPLLVGWALLAACLARDARVALRAAALGLLGLALSAFAWLPGFAERGWVQTARLLGTWVFDYRNNFPSLGDLLALPRAVDPSLINDWPSKALGLVPVLVALLAIARWRALERVQRWQVILLSGMALGFALLTLPVSLPLWDVLPLLSYVQFPWRFLGPAAFCLALLAGAAVSRRGTGAAPGDTRSRFSNLLPGLVVCALVIGSLGWFYPDHCAPPGDVSVSAMIAWERQTDTLGTTAKGEYLPVWVHRMPESAALQAAYDAGGPVVRLDPADLPEGARILDVQLDGLQAVIELESPVAFRARYLSFYYPGWRAWVDGEEVAVAPTDPEGLVAFDVPAGRHTVTVRLAATPLRLAANVLSLLALGGVVALAIWSARRAARRPVAADRHASSSPYLLLAAAFLVLLKLGVLDRFETPLRRSNLEGDRLRRVDVPAAVTFDDQFRLLGYDALPGEVDADRPLEVSLYWQDTVPGGPRYRATLALRDEAGAVWNDPELRTPRWHRAPPSAGLWPPDAYALTAYQLRLLPGTPPGVVTVTLGVFDLNSLEPYVARDGDTGPLGLAIPLGQVEVTRPRHPFTLDDVHPQYPADLSFGPLRLVGYNLDRSEAAPGDPFLLTLFWRADRDPGADLAVRLRLLDAQGEEIAVSELPPVRDGFPTGRWQAGDLWRGQHALRLPAGLESGEYCWTVELCQAGGTGCQALGQEFALRAFRVHAPQRVWEAPPLDVETGTSLGGEVTLLGATLGAGTAQVSSGDSLTVTLVWQAERELDTAYRVFVHLLGPDGAVVAQSDGEPVGWTRPTTGWLPGEVVLDERLLEVPVDAPPGEYRLQAGVYTLAGGRLTDPAGADALFLSDVTVEAP